MANLPQTLASETSEAINALIGESDRFRDLNSTEIKMLLAEVAKLQKVDAREAFVRFGSISAICGDVDGVFEFFRKALQHPNEPDTKHEFWISLANVGRYSNARAIGSWLLEPKRGFFPKVWQRAVSTGLVREVWERLPDAKKTFPDLSVDDFANVEAAANAMVSHGLNDDSVVAVLDLMGEIQRKHRIMFAGEFVSSLKVVRPPEDAPYLYFAVPLACDVVEIHALNRELARSVVEKLPDGRYPAGIVASFVKSEPLELLAAA